MIDRIIELSAHNRFVVLLFVTAAAIAGWWSMQTIPLDAIDPPALADYAGIVGHLLAKGHARTSGASMIAGYAGRSDKLDRALARFARAYADQTEADHAELVRAVRQGAVAATEGGLDRAGSAFRT